MAFVFSGLACLFAYLPFIIPNFRSNHSFIGLANCLAGGIFLSASLIHMLPSALGLLSKPNNPNSQDMDSFPMAPFTMLVSFSTILLVYRVLLPGRQAALGEPHTENFENTEDLGASILPNLHPHPANQAEISPYILVAAMGTYSLVEGAIFVLLFTFGGYRGVLAILLHKGAESFAVGISFARHNIPKRNTIISLLIFSTLTLIGFGIGFLFADMHPKLAAFITSISGGTILFISIVEVLSKEFQKPGKALHKYLAYLLGTGIMMLIWFIEHRNENPEE